MTEKTTQIKDEILLSLLPDVPFDGWTMAAAQAAAMRAGYGGDMARAVFPGGRTDLVAHFSDWLDQQMLARLSDVDTEALRVRDRIKTAVMARLQVMQEYREAEKLALSFWTLPSRSVKAGKLVWRTADRIWNWAGDTATDYNRYTKRGLLSGVISATTLAWINDDSETLRMTESFLDRRIENVMQFGRLLGKIKKRS